MSGLAGVLAQLKGFAIGTLVSAVLLIGSMSVAADAVAGAQPVRPTNADTVFDYVLVFPADADDQVLEAWRQRAFDLIKGTASNQTNCTPQVVRFHVAASWQLPMLGVRCVDGQARPIVPNAKGDKRDASAPIWLANTSVNAIRGQVAAMLQ
ncbi:hypothetical protein C7S18_16310 [Ahniella affigens]|uniref:Uncharacterized protein n=1 Tax=Ahniella affigens TaxID=2021234 RepID=A0A2P1PUY4_9GAMM|nr:hypothetical protein [Ahniella affigens]AVP98653.1 hypothetical protein C7S18_16310 [Ahniella affigens]